MRKTAWPLTLLSLFFLITASPAFSAQVAKVKGRSLLIDTQGDDVRPGEIYFVIDLNGSKKAIIKIMKVKGQKALAKLGKGRPQAGMALQKRGASAPRTARSSSQGSSSSSYSGTLAPAYWGGLLGIGMDSMTADVIDSNNIKRGTASTSGMSFSLMGLYDHRLFDKVWFRGIAGMETFKSSGGSQCGASQNQSCDVNITYLSANAIGRYLFSEDQVRSWIGGGVALMFPAAKDSNLLEDSSITSTYALIFTGGVDWQLSPNMYVPISIEYAMLPKSETVEASWIQLRLGMAVPF